MTPVALHKAESLRKYALASGCPLGEFALALTLGEAYELLDYLLEAHPASALLKTDVAQAKIECNPWPVLANFQLLGLEIVPSAELH